MRVWRHSRHGVETQVDDPHFHSIQITSISTPQHEIFRPPFPPQKLSVTGAASVTENDLTVSDSDFVTRLEMPVKSYIGICVYATMNKVTLDIAIGFQKCDDGGVIAKVDPYPIVLQADDMDQLKRRVAEAIPLYLMHHPDELIKHIPTKITA